MKKHLVSSVLVLLSCVQLLKAQDMTLWYQKPSVKWTDALPIGNGRLGAMVFGGVQEDRIQFNEETLWTGGPRDYNRKGAYKYLPQIRQLLFEGNQKAADALAEKTFMGMQSNEGDKAQWIQDMVNLKGLNVNPAVANFDDHAWKEITVPTFDGWETAGYEGLDGAIWYRTKINVPAAWLEKDLVLDLNRIRDYDRTYVNGQLVGSMDNADARKYSIPKGLLKAGENTIAIQVLNFVDKGGLVGYKDTSRVIGLQWKSDASKIISLHGKWKFFIQNDMPPAPPRYQADYQPFGDIVLKFPVKEYTGYARSLDISNAIAQTSYVSNGTHYTRKYFSSAVDQLIGIELSADQKKKVDVEISLKTPHALNKIELLNDSTIKLHLEVKYGALYGESLLRVRKTGGVISRVNGGIKVEHADKVELILVAGTNYVKYNDVSGDPLKKCNAALKLVEKKNFTQIVSSHIKEYKSYFDRFSIDFGKNEQSKLSTDQRILDFASKGDPALLSLYVQYSRYLLISSSRPGTRPANLQGIWNDLLLPPWGSKYTTNINAEMNYWPSELLNLSDCTEPMFTMIKELSQTGSVTAKEYYDAPGWVLHHNTDLWRGTAPINAANHGIWVSGSGWMSSHLWEHYLFTRDKGFLKSEAYPIMKSAADFYLHYLVKDPKSGYLISGPSNSPEQGGLVMGPTMDHQIIRSLFKSVVQASKELQVDDLFRDSLVNTLKQIAPDQIGKYGQLMEWMEDVDDPNNKHRHVSHLWGVYPGTEIVYGRDEKLLNAAKQSLLFRGDAATGWSLGWKINLWARFRDGDHVYTLLKMLLSPAEKGGAGSYINLFDAHPPFQIDGNFGGAAGIGEMLLQSHDGMLEILPALPSVLQEGTVKGIKARGGFELSFSWKAGILEKLDVLSTAGQPCVIVYAGKKIQFNTIKGKHYSFDASLQTK